MDKRPCPLCETSADCDWNMIQGRKPALIIDCPVCGWIRIETDLLDLISERGAYKNQLYLLSALSRRNFDRQQPRQIGMGTIPLELNTASIVEYLEGISLPEDPLDRVDRLLNLIQERSESFDSGGTIDPARDYPLLFLRGTSEYEYIKQIASKLGYIETKSSMQNVLTPAGWARIRELRSTVVNTKRVFVAMWFDKETDAAWSEGFKPALGDDLGYEPIRIDQREHINKIDDEIVSAIRNSGFLVADFTGDRGGVYFEAGLAMGLRKPVVWCCRNDEWSKKLHFDTRQYSHIMWNDPSDLRKRLAARVAAVIRPLLP